MNQAAIIYESKTGNTEKVAFAIKEGLENAGFSIRIDKVQNSKSIDFFEYDLICIGTPSYQWQPIKSVSDFLTTKFEDYQKQDRIKLGSPKIPGKNVLIFCTFSGPHTGINEGIPAGKIIGQFFEHLGFSIVGEWYILSEFKGSEEISTKGRMGDIRGKPNEEDLKKIRQDSEELAHKLKYARSRTL